jgi:CRISPR system Cascade subunit CasA
MHNLLTDPILSVQDASGSTQQLSLPGLFAALCRGDVESYPAMRSHHMEPWHVFTAQLAASVLARDPQDTLPGDAAFWEAGLRKLSQGDDTPWELCVEDLRRPAFLQHPLKDAQEFEKSFKPKTPKALSPDQLDILVTAKNHEVKTSRMAADDIQAWVYALVCYQTFSGYNGAGNYGSIRMNSGTGNRPVVSIVKDRGISARFQDEVPRLVAMRQSIVTTYRYQDRGPVLTWLSPWDREGFQWDVHALDPYFIEAVRAVRLLPTKEGRLVAYGATTKSRQIGPAQPDNGVLGDPWAPINLENKKEGGVALTLGEAGWSVGKIVDLLFKDRGLRVTPLQEPQAHAKDLWLLGYAIARGNGKTEGLHRLALPVPAKAVRSLFSAKDRASFGEFATKLLADADVVRGALRLSLFSLEESGPDKVDTGNPNVERWIEGALKTFQAQTEALFYPALWDGAQPEDRKSVRAAWAQELVALARKTLDSAQKSLPGNTARGYKAIVTAHSFLTGQLFKKGLLQTSPAATSAATSAKESSHA